MRKLISLFLIFSGVISPTYFAHASAPASYLDRVEAIVEQSGKYSSTEEWLEKSPQFSFFEKRLLNQVKGLSPILPKVEIERFREKIFLVTEGLKVDITRLPSGSVVLNGRELRFKKRTQLIDIAAALDKATRSGKGGDLSFLLGLFGAPDAHADFSDVCLGKWEFLLRTPYPLLDSKAGYLPHLLVASLLSGLLRSGTDLLRFCDAQAVEIRKLLKDNNVGIKEIDCGAEDSGSDRSIEFWIPERDKEGEFKTKKFHLDYSILVAEEEVEQPKDEDGEDLPRKIKTFVPENFYIFDHSSKLSEVRQMEPNAEDNNFQCTSVTDSNPKFKELSARVAPYQKVFQYIGENDTCSACKKEMQLKVRSVEPPTYFPPKEDPKKKVAGGKNKKSAPAATKSATPTAIPTPPERATGGKSAL